MRKICLVLMVLVGMIMLFQGCTKRWEEEEIKYVAPNWTSDGKIVFIEEKIIWKYEQPPFLDVNGWQDSKNIWLCEINSDGTGRKRIANILNDVLRSIMSTSSADSYVVMGEDKHKEIWVIKRDGTGLQKVGDGTYPDFSPDAEKIVYQSTNEGIMRIRREEPGIQQILQLDENASTPAWSQSNDKIVYISNDIFIIDTLGNILSEIPIVIDIPDWGPGDCICGNNWPSGKSMIFYLDSLYSIINIDTLPFSSGWGAGIKCSPSGQQFIGYDENGYFVINRDGTSKWYLKP